MNYEDIQTSEDAVTYGYEYWTYIASLNTEIYKENESYRGFVMRERAEEGTTELLFETDSYDDEELAKSELLGYLKGLKESIAHEIKMLEDNFYKLREYAPSPSD